MKYKSKVVEIEAIQFDGTLQSYDEIVNHYGMDAGPFILDSFDVKTLEGSHRASKGDWIIKGLIGEFYPCKDEVFQRKYEPVEAPARGSDVFVS